MPVTLRQIAEYTGLSKPTVTKILGRDAHLFTEETRRKVLAAAAKLGYRANTAAKSISTGRFNSAALILGYDAGRSDLPAGLLLGVQDELSKRDMTLNVSRLPDEKLTSEGFVPKVLRESMADGLLINYTHNIPEKMLELIRTHHAPAIFLNTKLPYDCVYPDDLAGAHQLTEQLLKLGHKRILYAKYDHAEHYSTVDRRDGYSAAMKKAGLSSRVISRHVPRAEVESLTHELLAGKDRPTAVIVRPEDASTYCVVAARVGLRVPQDLSIACIAGSGIDLVGLQLTCAVVPSDRVGRQAVAMLIEKIQSPKKKLTGQAIPFHLIAGETAIRCTG